jgi:hypothetical protein
MTDLAPPTHGWEPIAVLPNEVESGRLLWLRDGDLVGVGYWSELTKSWAVVDIKTEASFEPTEWAPY